MENKPKNQQRIYEDINDFYYSIINKKESGDLENFFTFLKGNPHQAPFNNALVFAQRPTCVYYMTANQWERIHGQKIHPNTRPMVILYPFGPVSFVYDYEDTEGSFVYEENTCLKWWHQKSTNQITIRNFENTVEYIDKIYQIKVTGLTPSKYFNRHSLSTGGYASGFYVDDKSEITLHPRYNPITNENVEEGYGVLVHEIAHIFLGHLGAKHYLVNRRGENVKRTLCEDRSRLDEAVHELEAELTAWLVFNRFGVSKNSVDYMAFWLKKDNDWQMVNLSYVLRTANTIFEMKK